LNKYVKWKFRG